ncbi:MAG: DUF1700 domain-containing protein [Ruminococcus sp.]|nr:DUF1700 domain-containing protein [Ruminococcus sp.]
MNKNEFLKRLREFLSPLSEEERNNAVSYYEEFIEDCESEEIALSQLGSPEEIAGQILRENGINSEKTTSDIKSEIKSPKNTTLIIIIIILTFPLWIGFVCGAFGLIVGAIALAFSIVVSTIAVGVSCLGSGIIVIFSSLSIGLVLLGLGLIAIALFALAAIPFFSLIINGIKKLVELIGVGFNKLFGKEV